MRTVLIIMGAVCCQPWRPAARSRRRFLAPRCDLTRARRGSQACGAAPARRCRRPLWARTCTENDARGAALPHFDQDSARSALGDRMALAAHDRAVDANGALRDQPPRVGPRLGEPDL